MLMRLVSSQKRPRIPAIVTSYNLAPGIVFWDRNMRMRGFAMWVAARSTSAIDVPCHVPPMPPSHVWRIASRYACHQLALNSAQPETIHESKPWLCNATSRSVNLSHAVSS
jgi:hypothetical protein